MSDPIIIDGTFIRTLFNGSAAIEAILPFPFQNLAQRHDVNNSGDVTASDALRVINELNARRFSDSVTKEGVDPLSVDSWPGTYFDTNGDGRFTAVDALQVINEMARISVGSGESEPVLQYLLRNPLPQQGPPSTDVPGTSTEVAPLVEFATTIQTPEAASAAAPVPADHVQ